MGPHVNSLSLALLLEGTVVGFFWIGVRLGRRRRLARERLFLFVGQGLDERLIVLPLVVSRGFGTGVRHGGRERGARKTISMDEVAEYKCDSDGEGGIHYLAIAELGAWPTLQIAGSAGRREDARVMPVAGGGEGVSRRSMLPLAGACM